ncbi:MAG: NnrS family protein [Alphaproteobacteria bacterium]
MTARPRPSAQRRVRCRRRSCGTGSVPCSALRPPGPSSPSTSGWALARHGYEMVFGVGGGVVGGFLLPAVPSWAGQPKAAG